MLRHLFFAAFVASLPVSGAARAKPVAPASATAPPLREGIDRDLKSGEPAQIRAALDDVRLAGKSAAAHARVIADLLRSGLDASLTEAALDTLGDLESEQGTEVLVWYTRHRTPSLRRAAVTALGKTRGPAAVAALRASLADPDPQVRAAAALGLGAMNAKDAVADLFLALDHKVNEAASSIGRVCAPVECERLADKLGQVPFEVVTSGLDSVLFRAPNDINDDSKIKVVGRLRELGTAEANRFLRDVAKRWPGDWSKRVKQAIDQAVLATGGAGAPSAGGTQ